MVSVFVTIPHPVLISIKLLSVDALHISALNNDSRFENCAYL
jgi:hypothetical protein